MRFSRAKFHNYRQFVDFEVELHGNLVCIVGLNGAGKSNFLRGLRFAVAGSVPNANKEDLLTWGAQSGYVEVDLEDESGVYTIHRAIKGDSTWCKSPSGEVTKNITPVNDKVLEWFGIDRQVADTVFVEQRMLDAILFSDPSAREIEFQKLCGMGDTNTIYRELGPLIESELAEDPGLTIRLSTAKDQRAETKNALSAVASELQRMKNLAPATTIDQLRDKQKINQDKIDFCNSLSGTIGQLSQCRQAVAAATTELENSKQLPGFDVDRDQLRTELSTMEHNHAQATKRQQVLDNLENARCTLQRTPQPSTSLEAIERLEGARAQVDALISKLNGSRNVFIDFRKAMESSEAEDRCPLCGADKDPEQIRARLAQEIDQLDAALAKSSGDQAKLRKLIPELKAKREAEISALQSAERAVERWSAQLSAYPDPGVSVEELEKQISDARARLRTANTAHTAIETSTAKLRAAQDAEAAQVQAFKKLAEQAAELDIDPRKVSESRARLMDERNKLNTQVEEITRYQTEYAAHQRRHAELEEALKRNKRVIDDLQAEVDALGTKAELREIITDVRNWFHYRNGPAAVAGQVLASMNDDVQQFLQAVDAPFTAQAVGADLTYKCEFTDGRLTPEESNGVSARDLSGAERSLLGAAVRLAQYVTFAGKLGVLTLDEPTSDMDPVTMRSFCTLMDRLRELAKQMNLQIMVNTHYKPAAEHADSVVEIQRR